MAAVGEVFLLYARQQVSDEQDARDLVQEAMVSAWRRSGGTVPDRALVFATIRRRAIDLGRSRRRRAARESAVAESAAGWFAPDPAQGDTIRVVAAALAQLPDVHREVVTLRIWGELAFPEISRLTGVPVPTLVSRYRVALDRLRETLGESLS